MAVINGAKSLEDVKRAVKGGFFSVLRVRTLPHEALETLILMILRSHG